MMYSRPHSSFPSRRRRPIVGATTAVAATAAVALAAYSIYDYYFASRSRLEEEEIDSQSSGWFSSWIFGSGTSSNSKSDAPKNRLDPRTQHKLARQLILNCRRETIKAYASCWPTVQRTIETATNTTDATKELKQLRSLSSEDTSERQAELWQRIQTEALTRYVTTVYASFLVVLSLTMQLSWVGGQVFKKGHEESPDSGKQTARHAQTTMVEIHDYMTHQGLPVLLSAVRRAVEAASEEWKPTTFLTLQDVNDFLQMVDLYLDRGFPPSKKHRRNWVRIVLPDVGGAEMSMDDTRASILEALWDLAESPIWSDAQHQALEVTKEYMQESGWVKAFDKASEGAEGPPKVPLAKLMPPLKSTCSLVTADGESTSPFLEKLQKLPTVVELGDVSFQP